MTELEKIFLTSSLTILGGVIVYVIGQLLSKFFIEPIHEQKRLIGEIADSLIFYSNVYTNPQPMQEKSHEVHEKFRQQATLLLSKTHMIPTYSFFSRLGAVICQNDIEEAFRNLIGLSNSVFPSASDRTDGSIISRTQRNSDTAGKIKKLLKLKIK